MKREVDVLEKTRPGRAKKQEIHFIRNEAHLQELAQELCLAEPRFSPALQRVGQVPLRTLPRGFPGLVRIIVGQQVSTMAARSIFARLEAGVPEMTSFMFHRMEAEDLRPFGLSTPKIRAMKALAAEIAEGRLDLAAVDAMADQEVVGHLTAVKGIGPWTAEIYLLFALGRADVWPAKDLALQKALWEIMNLRSHPKAERTIKLARRWRPSRGVAAHLLWAYYNQGRSAPVIKPQQD